jgi:hypothetical protein
MPIKHPRHDTDIEQFANDLAGRWKQGDGVEPWLRTMEPELSRKIRTERWSWESVARALNAAGIQYRTFRPWTGVSLLQKITSVRYEDRKRARRKSTDTRGTSTWEPPAPVSIPPAGTEFAIPDGEPAFKPATLTGHGGRSAADMPAPRGKGPAPVPPPAIDVDAILARFTGSK